MNIDIIDRLKRFIGLESDEEKINRFKTIIKSFDDSDANLNELASKFCIEKSLYEKRLSDPDNVNIKDRIQDKFDIFVKGYKEEVRKAKKEYDKLNKLKSELEDDEVVKSFMDQIRKCEAYSKIKKAYQDREISLDSFNTVIKGLTKEEKTKYADFLLFNENGELLLLKRSAWEDDNQGAWVIPGGHVDPGEDFETAAIRELREESGFHVEKPIINAGSFEDDKCHIEYFQSYVNTKEQPVLLDVMESRDYRWVKLEDLCDYPMIFNMADNVNKILGLDKINEHKINIRKAIKLGLIPVEKIEEITKSYHKDYDKLLSKLKIRRGEITKDDFLEVWKIFNTSKNNEGVEEFNEYQNHYKLKDLPFWPEGLDLENCEVVYIDKEKVTVIAGGDWQDGKYVTIGLADSSNRGFLDLEVISVSDEKPKGQTARERQKFRKENDIYKSDDVNNLYDELYIELSEMVDKRNSIIEKSMQGDLLREALDHKIEKAVKDISKLNKIKKLIYRDGKLIFATYYVKGDQILEDESKQSSSGIIVEDIGQGEEVEFSTKKRTSTGVVCGFSHEPKTDSYWICIQDEEGKKEWFNSASLTSYKKKSIQKEEYTVIKSLGGSTGALLVEDKFGNKYVKKTGKDKEHIDIEYQALKLYGYLGVDVPIIHKYDKEKGELYTNFIEKWQTTASDDLNDSKKFRKYFAIDALLGNWDVVGLEYDNVLIANEDYSLKFYRVDVGGSLTKRAQGENKEFGEEVTELKTMLDPNINKQTAFVFKDIDLDESIELAIQRYNQAENLIFQDGSISSEIKDILHKRVNYLKKVIEDNTLPAEGFNYKGKLYNVDKEQYGEDVYNFYERLNTDLIITDKDIEILKKGSQGYFDNETAKNKLESKGLTTNDLYKEAKEKGVTDLELLVINDYTGSSTDYNDLAKSYINSGNGNFNFDNEKIFYGGIKEVEKTFPIESYFQDIVSAAKSLNYAKDSGKEAAEMNSLKFDKVKEINELIDKEIKNTPLSDPNINSLISTKKIIQDFFEAYENNSSLPKIEKPENLKDFTKKEKINVSESGEEVKFNGFIGKNKTYVAKLKILCHALKKLETSITNPKYFKYDTFNRGIDVYGDKADLFRRQHEKDGQLVMHQWGSSSSWESYGFASSRNTLLKIVGKGIHINDLSSFKSVPDKQGKFSEGESEVLHRPFSLFRTVTYQEENPNFNNKRTVAIQKMDI